MAHVGISENSLNPRWGVEIKGLGSRCSEFLGIKFTSCGCSRKETRCRIYPPWNGQFAPENRPKPKRKGSSSNHQFSGAFAVSFREGTVVVQAVISLHGRTFSTNGLSIPTSFMKRSKFKAVYVLTHAYIYFFKIHVHRYLPGTCQCPFSFFGSCFTQNKIQTQSN